MRLRTGERAGQIERARARAKDGARESARERANKRARESALDLRSNLSMSSSTSAAVAIWLLKRLGIICIIVLRACSIDPWTFDQEGKPLATVVTKELGLPQEGRGGDDSDLRPCTPRGAALQLESFLMTPKVASSHERSKRVAEAAAEL